jgi:hypothetical protein
MVTPLRMKASTGFPFNNGDLTTLT